MYIITDLQNTQGNTDRNEKRNRFKVGAGDFNTFTQYLKE